MRPAEAPSRIDWVQLLDLAERVGVQVWRYDAGRGRVVQVESVEDLRGDDDVDLHDLDHVFTYVETEEVV